MANDFDDDEDVAPNGTAFPERFNPALARLQRFQQTGPAYKNAPKQEKKTTKRLVGARAIPASGSRFRKGDVEIPTIARIECKSTQAKSFSVTLEMIAKVDNAGLGHNQMPVIDIEFVNLKGTVLSAVSVIPRRALETLLNRLADAEGITAPTVRQPRKRP